MEFGKIILGASLIVMALLFVVGNNAVALKLTVDSTYTYVAGAVAGILGIVMLVLVFKKIQY